MKKGQRTPLEIRIKISIAQKGRKLTEEHKKKLSVSHKGKISPQKGNADITRNCKRCSKLFTFSKHLNKKYCHRSCMEGKYPEPRFCIICNKIIPGFNTIQACFYKNRKVCSFVCRGKFAAKDRIGIPVSGYGKDHWNWKGGRGTKRHTLMHRQKYKLWRTAIFIRDNYTCQICFKRGSKIHADHIKGWAKYPKLRYDINNGRTLCVNCHYEITFGKTISSDIKWG